ncbi:MAG: hypothetical protein RLO81_11180, partial [Fulvivirga sp.]|uniref:hypothetical protein n=1 Tax=Fulvivirga sp. TaxID=1931237 RepID=UPI0032EE86EF
QLIPIDVDCLNPTDGKLRLELNTSVTQPPYTVTIVDQDNPTDTIAVDFASDSNWQGDLRDFPTTSSLISGEYTVIVSSTIEGVCDVTQDFAIQGGSVPITFNADIITSCNNNQPFNELELSQIVGENNIGSESFVLRVLDFNDASQELANIPFNLDLSVTQRRAIAESENNIFSSVFNSGNRYLFELTQDQTVCGAVSSTETVDFDTPDDIVPQQTNPITAT